MLINHNEEKLCNAIIYFVKNTKYCYKTKLMKLLYFLDFVHFKESGKSVTDLEYFAWDFGPYPVELGNKIDNCDSKITEYVNITSTDKNYKFIPKKKFDSKYFTKRELRILNETADIFKEAYAEQMVEITHLKNKPWDTTIKKKGEKAKIDYLLAFEESIKDMKDFIDNIEDRKEFEKVLK